MSPNRRQAALAAAALAVTTGAAVTAEAAIAQESNQQRLRVGIIGLDTSHAPAFAKAFNADPADPEMKNCRVVAAYPFGSRTIPSSSSRIPKYTQQVKAMGVEIVDSIDAMLEQVDCVLLETNDGKPHLDQALQVFRAGKPVFIDKPVASNLAEVVAVFRAAEQSGVPMFSSSSLRYSRGAQAIRAGEVGEVLACNAYSPASVEPSHTDLFWYGIHGVETLYTCMGAGCQSVRHHGTSAREVAVGAWSGGRIGSFYGLREGKTGYGGTAFGSKAIAPIGKYDGYRPLLIEIAKFFQSKQPPIDASETIELYAFMEAAMASRKSGGAAVTIDEVMKQAEKSADSLLKKA